MSNLTPVQRVNKLGHTVTKHVRTAPPATAMKAMIPPPSGQSSAARRKSKASSGEYKPTNTQKEFIPAAYFHLGRFKTDTSLKAALAPTMEPKMNSEYSWGASDVQAYEMIAHVDVANAVALGCYGIDNKEAALEFLTEKGLDHLVTDNSAVADMALRRRVRFYDFCEASRLYGDKTSDPAKLVDLAVATSSSTVQKINNKLSKTVEERILDGEISMAEIDTIGVSAITHSNMPDRIIETLGKVHRGEVDMTAAQVKEVLAKYNAESALPDIGRQIFNIADEFGGDFVLGLESVRSSGQIYQWLHERSSNHRPQFVKDVIEYNDAMDRAGVRPKFSTIPLLMRTGYPAHKSAELLASGYTPAQIITMSKENVPANLADGFL